jgi:hypothetical protein
VRGIFVGQDYLDILMLMYADDICLIDDSVFGLQRKINILYSFCNKWGFLVNLDKTEVLVFRNGGTLKSIEHWNYGNEKVRISTYYNYLGLMCSNRLSWTKGIRTLLSKANKAIVGIKQIQYKFKNIPPIVLFKMFDTQIKPIILYTSEIWGHSPSIAIESVHAKFCKFVIGVGNHVSNVAVLGECGRESLNISCHVRCIKYWCKLLYMSDDRYPKQCYYMLKSLDNVNRHTWVTDVKRLLFQYGFGYIWIAQDVGDSDIFIDTFARRMKDCNQQAWYESVCNNSKLYMYKEYKSLLNIEMYLLDLNTREFRRLFFLLRTGELPLRRNTGRWVGLPKTERICQFCNLHMIEDEYHFVFICPLYTDLRIKYIRNSNIYSMQTFYQLLSTRNTQVLVNVCKFVKYAIMVRKDSM